MAKKRILILGVGLAGLSAAWHLQRKGIDCQVFEKDYGVGGFIFDYSGHLLHFRHRYTFDLVKNFGIILSLAVVTVRGAICLWKIAY